MRVDLDQIAALTSLIDAEVGYSFLVYEVTIVDRDGTALISSDSSLPGRTVTARPPLGDLVNASFIQQLRQIYGPPKVYDVSYPFRLGAPGRQVPFGDIRVAAQTGLLRSEITPALRSAGLLALAYVLFFVLLAAVVSNAPLAPLERISSQLDHISRGEFDQQPLERADEFGQVSTKIVQIGQQLRGVREIFSTLRENLDQVLGGLEDGLVLFTRDGRAVMVSPAVEHFLGATADHLLGRKAGEIFPPRHPLRAALGLVGDEFESVAAAEFDLPGKAGSPPQRIVVSVQVITERGTRMGALVTLRDLESLERIGRQLQVSERLAALGRVTAGVAHEVKNPLNSMRLWLENLKECLPWGEEMPRQQAVAVLDKEIDRFDAVVQRFLDFTRPMDIRLEATQLSQLLPEGLEIAQPKLQKAGIQLAQLLPIEVPEVYVDRALLKQAVLNLVLNAAEAMPNGGQLRLVLSRRGEMAEITVQDTGRGIPPENKQKIFQLFFTTRPGGSGIGLASAFRIVQLHNGSIDFTSEVGRGTTFRIELPLAA